MSLISVSQAAGVLGVSRATAYRMVQERRLPTVRWLKRGIKVHAEQLQQMIDAEAAASISSADGVSEVEICPIKEPIPRFGGSLSHSQMEKEFDALLALPTTRRRKQ